jgi:PST family polysaccharide transporter
MFALFVPALVYAGQPLGIGVKDVLPVMGPQTVAGLSAVAFGFTVQHVFLIDLSQLVRFFVSALICLTTYLAVAVGIFRVTGPLQLAFSVLKEFGPMRSRGSS